MKNHEITYFAFQEYYILNFNFSKILFAYDPIMFPFPHVKEKVSNFIGCCFYSLFSSNFDPIMLNVLFLNRDFAKALCSVLVMIKDFRLCIACFVCNLVFHNVNLDGTEFFIGKRDWQEMLHAVCQGPLHCME